VEVLDILDGVKRTPGEMWTKLRERAGLGRNEWHIQAGQYTNRILSSPNNLSAVSKDKRNMPLHDIVPMLKAFNLDEAHFNHYVREFLRAQLPRELTSFFSAPDASAETFMLREANLKMHSAVSRIRTQAELANAISRAQINGSTDEEISCPNNLWCISMEHGEQTLDERKNMWTGVVIEYYEYVFSNEKKKLKLLNKYLQMALPEDWENTLFNELNFTALQLQKFDAPTLSNSWIENCLHLRPLDCILGHLTEDWYEEDSESAQKYFEAWSRIPMGLIESKQVDSYKINKYVEEYFKDKGWKLENSLADFIKQYVFEGGDAFRFLWSSINPINDFYGGEDLACLVLCNYARYHQFSSNSKLTFTQCNDFGFPPVQQKATLARDFVELILFSTYTIRFAPLSQHVSKFGIEAEKFGRWLQSINLKSSSFGMKLSAVEVPEQVSLDTLILGTPNRLHKKYKKRLIKITRRIAVPKNGIGDFLEPFSSFAKEVLSENAELIIKEIEEAEQRELEFIEDDNNLFNI
jgi:hypothetical protein